MPNQRAVLLKADDTAVGDAQQVDVPAYTGETAIYAKFISPASPKTDLAATLVPISEHTQSKIYIIHAPPSSNKNSRINSLANTVLTASSETNEPVKGDAVLMYGAAGKDMLINPDWRCLHDVCYESQLSSLGGKKQSTVSAKALAEDFESRLSAVSTSNRSKEAVVDQEEDEDDGAWTDEDVEAHDAPTREADSDSDEDAGEEDGEEESEEDDEGEGESELESDDEDDPKKKALLDAIRNMILTDGKLDLNRLGLVEKNGQLVPKDDA